MQRELVYVVRYPVPGSALFEVTEPHVVTRSYYQRLKRRFPDSYEYRHYVLNRIEHELQVSSAWLETRRNKKQLNKKQL